MERKKYSDDHWIKWNNAEEALAAYMEQQSKSYSKLKNAFVRELLGDLNGKRFMDYGCGAGMFTVYAAQQNAASVLGVDAEESALETAKYFADSEGVANRCSFMRIAEFPEFKTPQFDVILMKDVIEHVPNDGALLRKAASALVPGGIIVLSTQNSFSLNYLVQGTYHRSYLGNKDWFGWDDTHLRFYSPMSLERKLRDADFQITEWRSVYIIPHKIPFKHAEKTFLRVEILAHLDKYLGRFFPYNRLGWNVIVKAKSSTLLRERLGRKAVSGVEVMAKPAVLPGACCRTDQR